MIVDAPDAIILDLRGLNCPLPALRTLKALRAMAPGATLIVECTDPMAAIDVPHCVSENGHELESQSADAGVLRFCIRRKAA
jgi:tRNA 2-thiouridine synthesizing protein A